MGQNQVVTRSLVSLQAFYSSYKKIWIGIALAATLLLAARFTAALDWPQVKSALSSFNFAALLVALGWILSQVVVQGTRLWVLLPAKQRPAWKKLIQLYSAGQWLNLFAPARAGDFVKVISLSNASAAEPLSATTAATSVIADKLIDILALLVLLAATTASVSIGEISDYRPSITPAVLVVVLTLVAGAVALWFTARRIPALSQVWRTKIAPGLVVLRDPKIFVSALGLGLLAWLVECWALGALCRCLGYALSVSDLIRVLTILNLGIAIPISPANVGTFEAAVGFGLSRFQVPIGDGVVIASVHHLLQMLGVSLVALNAWFFGRGSRQLGVSGADKQKAIGYYAGIADRYNSHVEKGLLKVFRDRERGMVISFSGLDQPRQTPGSMIDVGCGGGFYALLAKRAGFTVCAVDAVPEMLDKLRDSVDRVAVVDIEQSMEHLKLGQYDLVICAGVLDFTVDPEKAFQNLCLLVAPGGRLVVLAPRTGLGGLYYRFEKRLVGISVNCFALPWLQEQARKNNLRLTRADHPLPTNRVAVFER